MVSAIMLRFSFLLRLLSVFAYILFIDDNTTLHHTVGVAKLLCSEDILHMDRPVMVTENVWDLLQRCLVAHD
ncbi:hypothetical protein CEXT_16381 [Caerostris extrusa]|uniref:Secreted protein n=1 Tax=Caerostris extrusa TaxID=172846 RepID=A0AAV4RJ31_CAEEX|nr:hypothetical protein CEXT_16381 [Caerostris extrusa]